MQLRYEINSNMFSKIPGYPFAYWGSASIFKAFENKQLSSLVDCKSGIMTGDEKFIHFWFEPSINTIKFDCDSSNQMLNYKWFPLNSGGEFRKWYGNLDKVVDLFNDGEDIKKYSKNFRLRDKKYYFQDGITWGRITSSRIAFRTVKEGTLFGDAGPVGFISNKKMYVLSFLSSKVVGTFLSFINPTMNFQVGDVMRLPIYFKNDYQEPINAFCSNNIDISKQDWDSFETSWDFKKHPLI